ncbi:MAG: hypothetical protein IPM51_15775 [Sphingobacteriaceae bacterium]|nr:hypothetical protein [Sphingobacteriaceae bacterium]
MRGIVYILFIFQSLLSAQDTLHYGNMTPQQDAAWKKIEFEWKQNQFSSYIERHKIKLNCSNCPSIMAHLFIIKENSETRIKVINLKICGETKMNKRGKEFVAILKKIKLPEAFNNCVLKIHIGSALKC